MSLASGNSVVDLQRLPLAAIQTLAEEVQERDERWNVERELLARLNDLVMMLRIEALAGMGVKKPNLPKFEPVPRPGDPVDEGPATVSPRELARMVMQGVF